MSFPFIGGYWPLGGFPVQLEPPPSKPEHIYLDQNPGWYQDTRKEVSEDLSGVAEMLPLLPLLSQCDGHLNLVP